MKLHIALVVASSIFMFSACKNKTNNTPAGESTQTQTPADGDTKTSITNQPKEYKVTFTPDTALLGKSKEAFVKITGATAVSLQDPDGKDNGIELTVKLVLTNRQNIGQGSGIHVDYPNSRVQLDNGTNITCETGTDYLRAEPEATSKEESWKYRIPAAAKPVALNLFMDETRVSLKLSLDN